MQQGQYKFMLKNGNWRFKLSCRVLKTGSLKSVAPGSGDLWPSFGPCGQLHVCGSHLCTQACMHTCKIRNNRKKNKNKIK